MIQSVGSGGHEQINDVWNGPVGFVICGFKPVSGGNAADSRIGCLTSRILKATHFLRLPHAAVQSLFGASREGDADTLRGWQVLDIPSRNPRLCLTLFLYLHPAGFA